MANYQLNLVLHGSWGIENNTDAIRIVTIEDKHHVIKAGDVCDPKYDLSTQKFYELVGVTPGPPANFRRDQNPTIDNKTADERKVKVVIDLPYPREINSVRREPTRGRKFFKNDFPITPTVMSVAQVLVYDVEDLTALRLKGSGWEPQTNQEHPNIVTLHLYADPDTEKIKMIREEIAHGANPLGHATMVLRTLADAFGLGSLEITPLILADIPPVLEDPIDGLTKLDTVTLFECEPQPAVSPANCDFLISHNRGD